MTFRDIIGRNSDDGVAWHEHDAGDISGEAVFTDLKVDRLLGGTISGKEIIVAGGVDGILRSDNFVAGSAGWQIDGSGAAEFNDVTVRGVITAGAGSDVDWSYISNVSIETADIQNAAITNAKIASLTASKITGGTITAETIILSNSASSILKSGNYSSGSAGWQIDGSGAAEFNDVTVRGTIFANAGEIGNLSVVAGLTVTSPGGFLRSDNFVAGSAGWQILASGAAEFNNITARGTIKTASSGQRIEVGTNATSQISFYTGNGSETNPGLVQSFSNYVIVRSPNISSLGVASVQLTSQSGIGGVGIDTLASVDAEQVILSAGSGRVTVDSGSITLTGNVFVSGGLRLSGGGTAASPSLTFTADSDTGVYRPAADQIGFAVGGVAALSLRTSTPIFGIMQTTASAATAYLSPTNTLFRSTSSRRYKTAFRPWDGRASVLDLEPTLFRSKLPDDDPERVRLGLIAEDVAEAFPLAAIFDGEGMPESIDWNTIVTGLLDEVRTLRARVGALEAA